MSLAQAIAKIFQSQISSQTIKYLYKFKLNPQKIIQKVLIDPLKVHTKFQVLAEILQSQIFSQTIKYLCKFKSNQKNWQRKI